MKKLVEGLPFYRDKLHEEGVYARFQEILVKVKICTPSTHCLKLNIKHPKARSNKTANKSDAELNEFETVRVGVSGERLFLTFDGLNCLIQVLEENRRQGAEDQAFEKRVEGKKAAAKKRATRRSTSFTIHIAYPSRFSPSD